MTTHAYHGVLINAVVVDGDFGEIPQGRPILFDDCPRCEEQAENPVILDGSKTEELWNLMVEVNKPGYRGMVARKESRVGYRTAAEKTAGDGFYRIAVFLERAGIYPWMSYEDLSHRYGTFG